MPTEPTSGVVLISEGVYRLLLHLYPRAFRDEWGMHMSRTFRDHSREQYQRDGMVGIAGLWMFTAIDVTKAALDERVKEVVKSALDERAKIGERIMSKDTAIRVGGPMMILGGLVWIIANLGHMPTEYFGGIDFDPVWTFAFPPLLVGLYGLTVYAGTSYPLRAAAWVALVSGGAAYVGVLGRVVPLFLLAVLVMVLAIMSFGHIARREKPLPRWNGVGFLMVAPLAALAISPIFNVLFLGLASLDIFPNLALTTMFGLVGLCWVLIGVAMLPSKLQPAAVP